MRDSRYTFPLEVVNRTDRPLEIAQVEVEVYNVDLARRLGAASPLVFHQTVKALLHLEAYQHRVVEIPGGQMLPQEMVARFSYPFRKGTSDFRIRRAGIEIPFPAPQSLPDAAIARGLDSRQALNLVLPRAQAWSPDATLHSMIAPDRQIAVEPATGLELVIVEGWLLTFVSARQRAGRLYHVTAKTIEESDQVAPPPPCPPVALPRLGNQQALELANRQLAICANWNGSRLPDVPVTMKGPRLNQDRVEGQTALLWFLPYLGPDQVPIVMDAETGDRVRLVDGNWRRFPWAARSGKADRSRSRARMGIARMAKPKHG